VERRLRELGISGAWRSADTTGSCGLNAKIQWIKYTARGFRNRENFKTAIYFRCGALDLYPH